jgi:sialic acid synthase SpsE
MINNKDFIEIEGIKIGPNFPPVVIAEIGINHNGSLKIAKEMVDSAFKAGVKIIKHQTHIADQEMSKEAKEIVPVHTKENIFDIIDKCSLSENEEYELMNYVKSKGMIFLSTPFSREAADRLHRWDVPAYKIGSGECNNYPLLDHIASFGKPIILSTGMNTIESISKAIDIIKRHKVTYAILHTTNLYPTPDHLVRLGAITDLINEFPNTIVGLSDHTLSNHSSFGAIALGASIIERHYTDTKKRIGPDIVCSMDEEECKKLLEGVKILYKQRWGKKIPVKEEKDTANFAFASVVSIKKIKKGDIFSKDNLWVKRPGTGEILAENLSQLYGKRSQREINKDEFIKLKDYK